MVNHFFRFLEITAVVAGMMILSSNSAHAYIDPGTGSYVFQSIVAGVLAGLFVVKSRWSQIKSAVAKRFSNRQDD